ncbi:hypothetical protein AAHU26_22405 [Klebsiella quasipneumoniae subsp. similipneumoniae]|nr:hypothetical protein [Klebsiella quasipneumoniae]MCJ1839021.1 hypothetical protein [Klebsiella quasipneumoniae subsp. similipneumoniae]MDQ5385441.1 hypothetical protein [Klebsiella quasipneumoniae subsp. similipneumoniae]MDQ5438772.1 hypothetical protein [Klebsiella quasipneumoniae subsp. similipneumoniae]NKF15562.1 hypothetical protein [Klebsiella quasipneumoniae]QPV81578.1 hypothetical protein I8N77_22955 [Klebsiella quasipneumoniae]
MKKQQLWRETYHNNARECAARGCGKAGKRKGKNVIQVGFQAGDIG